MDPNLTKRLIGALTLTQATIISLGTTPDEIATQLHRAGIDLSRMPYSDSTDPITNLLYRTVTAQDRSTDAKVGQDIYIGRTIHVSVRNEHGMPVATTHEELSPYLADFIDSWRMWTLHIKLSAEVAERTSCFRPCGPECEEYDEGDYEAGKWHSCADADAAVDAFFAEQVA